MMTTFVIKLRIYGKYFGVKLHDMSWSGACNGDSRYREVRGSVKHRSVTVRLQFLKLIIHIETRT